MNTQEQKPDKHTLMRGCGAGGVRLDERTGEGKGWKNTGRRENNTEGGTDKQHATDHDTLSVKAFKHFTCQQDCAAVNRFTLSHYLPQISSFLLSGNTELLTCRSRAGKEISQSDEDHKRSSEGVFVFLQLMSELVLSARLCLLTDWILFKDPGSATFESSKTTGFIQSLRSRDEDEDEGELRQHAKFDATRLNRDRPPSLRPPSSGSSSVSQGF